MNMLV